MSVPPLETNRVNRGWLVSTDPRAKITASLLMVLTVSLMPIGSWLEYALLYLLILALAVWSRLSIGWLWRRSLLALPFMLAAVVLPFTVPGTPIVKLPMLGWTMSYTGTVQGISLLLRTWVALQIFILLMGITRIQDIFWGLEALWLPPLLVSIISFAYRYLAVLRDEAQRMSTARRARQTGERGDLPAFSVRMKYIGGFFGSLLLRGLERSERVYGAMVARGYDGTIRTLRRFRWNSQDSFSLILLTFFLAALLLTSLAKV